MRRLCLRPRPSITAAMVPAPHGPPCGSATNGAAPYPPPCRRRSPQRTSVRIGDERRRPVPLPRVGVHRILKVHGLPAAAMACSRNSSAPLPPSIVAPTMMRSPSSPTASRACGRAGPCTPLAGRRRCQTPGAASAAGRAPAPCQSAPTEAAEVAGGSRCAPAVPRRGAPDRGAVAKPGAAVALCPLAGAPTCRPLLYRDASCNRLAAPHRLAPCNFGHGVPAVVPSPEAQAV